MKTTILFLFAYIFSTLCLSQNHVMKIQIQGKDMQSPLVSTWDKGVVITKLDAIYLLDQLWRKCSQAQKKERDQAINNVIRFIQNAPANGIISSSNWSKSFQNQNRNVNDSRIDIEIYRGAAFSDDRHIVYIRIEGSDLTYQREWKWDEKYIVGKNGAVYELNRLWNSLDTQQKQIRSDAYNQAIYFINSAPINGYIGENKVVEFKNSNASKGELIRIRIDKGAAFSL
ncbi:MAG: hypothetical protein HY842_15545 [Bacteroidetes bacterium]|nr:hypothetical protein [Bacteroidota bacterium]